MRSASIASRLLGAGLALILLAAAGCTDSVNDLLPTPMPDIAGTWSYEITNGDLATFTNCTGDVAYLEGTSFNDALAMAPICMPGASFDVFQNSADFQSEMHSVTCSDGSTADVIGLGTVGLEELDGEWDTANDSGVDATQPFTGLPIGDDVNPVTMLIETSRTFGGTLNGSCDLVPALITMATISP